MTTRTAEPVTIARPAAPYASGDRIGGRYEVLEAFGVGPLGTTYRARDPDGMAVAVKVLPTQLLNTPVEQQGFLDAVTQNARRTFEHVVPAIDAGLGASSTVYIVSPWIYGVSLRRMLRAYRAAERQLAPDQVLGVLLGVASALREFHTASAHGALYPESIHITADAIVLADAGLAAALPPVRLASQMEHHPDVLPYIAPEVRAGKRCNAGADFYSFGALASELLFGDAALTAQAQVNLRALEGSVGDQLRALVGLQPARRLGAVQPLLDRLGALWSPASLPPYAPLPPPSAMNEARTRRVRSFVLRTVKVFTDDLKKQIAERAAREDDGGAAKAPVIPEAELIPIEIDLDEEGNEIVEVDADEAEPVE